MPPKQNGDGASPSGQADGASRKSDLRIIKEGGYTSMLHMMHSYGLKLHDDGDLQQAKDIIAGMRKLDETNEMNERTASGSGR